MATDRAPRAAPSWSLVDDWARRAGRAGRTWVVRAPGTHAYLLVLLVTTLTVRSLHPSLANELLRQLSTNLFQMGRNAWRVLFLSAFLVAGGGWIAQVALFTLVYAPLERWAGSWRWLAVVAAGHVGATLVTTVGIWADVRSNPGATHLATSIDVGVSYGFFAGAGFLTFAIGRRWLRWGARGGLFVLLGVPLLVHHSFTDAGHLAALCIGLAMWGVFEPTLKHRPRWWTPRTRSSAFPVPPGDPLGTALSP